VRSHPSSATCDGVFLFLFPFLCDPLALGAFHLLVCFALSALLLLDLRPAVLWSLLSLMLRAVQRLSMDLDVMLRNVGTWRCSGNSRWPT